MLGGVHHTHEGTDDRLLTAYFRHVAPEDLAERDKDDLVGAWASHLRVATRRSPGTAGVHVHTPTVQEHGWSAAGHTVVEVVTDDMPFLVDSVVMELSRLQHDVHLVVHPGSTSSATAPVCSQRGRALSTSAVTRPTAASRVVDAPRDRRIVGDGTSDRQLEEDLRRVLGDVRAAVEDWDGHARPALEIVGPSSRRRPAPLPPRRSGEGRGLLSGWPTTTSRSSATASTLGDDDDPAARVPARAGHPACRSGSRRDQGTTGPSFAKLPPLVRAKAREKTCWSSPRPTPGRRCTARRTSTTSA
jgi:glutamate dehydrogenase